uniref:serine/threonine-protein kinase ATG1 isoform X1 n=2 Tax=Ciona intestinalis TaxID=7719 RepID=UPI000180C286|nr:serine/threonine-protein kinase ATG1 isoform X1 [Ciona intestinalis]|eukprot:XP_002129459.1 serine/threonine-protein kinase ATG1 isoform X1 [Ciona intestinalis]
MDKYKILGKIGNGSFGTVYKASKKGKKSEALAIKQVRCNAPENVELALQEFWTLSSLQHHPNIIRFEECVQQHPGGMKTLKHGDTNSNNYLSLVEMSIKGKCDSKHRSANLWFVMEYCDGGDMNDYLLSRLPLASLNSSFMIQLADGISFLHRSNVVHRDLKPENILVRKTSKDDNSIPLLKIADFGLSKVCTTKDTSDTNVNHQWFSSACGSDFFMAPEVFEGRYTAKADVFALGVIFWSIMDRITFIDASTKKVLLGTYVRRDTEVLPLGEVLLDDPKLNIARLLEGTSRRKPVGFVRGMNKEKKMLSSTCVDGDKDRLREVVCMMVDASGDVRPTAEELLTMLQDVLVNPMLPNAEAKNKENGKKITKQGNKKKKDENKKVEEKSPGCQNTRTLRRSLRRKKTLRTWNEIPLLPPRTHKNSACDVIKKNEKTPDTVTTVNDVDCDKQSTIVTRSRSKVKGHDPFQFAVKKRWLVYDKPNHGDEKSKAPDNKETSEDNKETSNEQSSSRGRNSLKPSRTKLSLKDQIKNAAKVSLISPEPTTHTGLRRSGRTIRKPAKLRLKLNSPTKVDERPDGSSPNVILDVGVQTRSKVKYRRKGKIQKAQIPSPDVDLPILITPQRKTAICANQCGNNAKRALTTPSAKEMPAKRQKLTPQPQLGASGNFIPYLPQHPLFPTYYLPGEYPYLPQGFIAPGLLHQGGSPYPLRNGVMPHNPAYPFQQGPIPISIPNIAARP